VQSVPAACHGLLTVHHRLPVTIRCRLQSVSPLYVYRPITHSLMCLSLKLARMQLIQQLVYGLASTSVIVWRIYCRVSLICIAVINGKLQLISEITSFADEFQKCSPQLPTTYLRIAVLIELLIARGPTIGLITMVSTLISLFFRHLCSSFHEINTFIWRSHCSESVN